MDTPLTSPVPSRTTNLGILAHVDAGKTSLTERLLLHAGVIGELGRVDDGSTQTDTLALERARGITIKAAVVSFELATGAPGGPLTVNLVDTPGHSDFIAEVECSLAVRHVRAAAHETQVLGEVTRRRGEAPAESLHELQHRVPGLTSGLGDLVCGFDGYRPVVGPRPSRPRTDLDPLHRREYLLRVAGKL